MTAGGGPAARAESIGIPATSVDGNDLVAVDTTARRLIEAHNGQIAIECPPTGGTTVLITLPLASRLQ